MEAYRWRRHRELRELALAFHEPTRLDELRPPAPVDTSAFDQDPW